MRTAEEYLRQGLEKDCIWDEGYPHEFKIVNTPNSLLEKIINEARKEAIEECANRAKASPVAMNLQGDCYPIVDKQSILSLISELK